MTAEKKKAAKAKKKQSKSGSSKKSYAEAAGAKRCEDVKDSCDYQLSNIGMDDILEAMVESIMEICCDDMNPTVRSEVAKSTMKKLRGKLMGADAHIHPTDVKTQVDTTNYQDESDDSDESDDDNDAKMELCEISDIHEKSTEKSNSNSDFHVQKQKFGPPPTHSPTALPGGWTGSAGSPGWIRGKSELFQKKSTLRCCSCFIQICRYCYFKERCCCYPENT